MSIIESVKAESRPLFDELEAIKKEKRIKRTFQKNMQMQKSEASRDLIKCTTVQILLWISVTTDINYPESLKRR